MIVGNLLYLLLTAGFVLWRFSPEFELLPIVFELSYTFIVFPLTVLMFLNSYPQGRVHIAKHYAKWILLYSGFELVLAWNGRMLYGNGWNWYYSTAFDVLMFPMLLLHSRKPLIAYAVSVPIIILLVWYFKVPIEPIARAILETRWSPAN